ncbi:hypothetical protein [Paenibacillus mucilaginosus]|uniref:hypothetical protein n=1 Tax=Paenibacillus mucilaginosus TaxID=61624 RepID=UPI00117D9C21|nr:hypothetical protein [Paenibacillus mucilaginosus]MCG7213366.1 hypothetical protein [Paenibacillus mucilaginosus]WDM29486.1 hypothetical protein KCX80_10145 [Paenibacillus mucilaginosus]
MGAANRKGVLDTRILDLKAAYRAAFSFGGGAERQEYIFIKGRVSCFFLYSDMFLSKDALISSSLDRSKVFKSTKAGKVSLVFNQSGIFQTIPWTRSDGIANVQTGECRKSPLHSGYIRFFVAE